MTVLLACACFNAHQKKIQNISHGFWHFDRFQKKTCITWGCSERAQSLCKLREIWKIAKMIGWKETFCIPLEFLSFWLFLRFPHHLFNNISFSHKERNDYLVYLSCRLIRRYKMKFHSFLILFFILIVLMLQYDVYCGVWKITMFISLQ